MVLRRRAAREHEPQSRHMSVDSGAVQGRGQLRRNGCWLYGMAVGPGKACVGRRTRGPSTTLSPRLRASARLPFPGARPIPSARALCWKLWTLGGGSGRAVPYGLVSCRGRCAPPEMEGKGRQVRAMSAHPRGLRGG